jgi:hypothetical protein
MPSSYRIRTKIGEDTNLQVKLDQDFDMLEILSFKIYQKDIYTRDCGQYGVVCGRVFCNKGTGLPNARVSIFIPVDSDDENNPIVSSIYPYKDLTTVNEDGYKYNLLPYTKSYSNHVPVGTFPDKIDVLQNETASYIYEKYYKFSAKTNDAGDFMIFGVPLGQQTIFMQIDLSDMGEFSLTPQDIVRMGLATEDQVSGTKFEFNENYSVLPQIITLAKTINVSPFFGQKDICDYNVGRVDFDLTTEANVRVQPTSVFMGSIISTPDKQRIQKKCRVKSVTGELCTLVTGPGQIEAIRHSFYNDEFGRPVLEQYKLPNNGKIIDDNGTWLAELPMNIDYVYTDEDGNRVISNDPDVGIPTKGRYRFKVKWQQPPSPSLEFKRGYFLVPNIKEHGWNPDASTNSNGTPKDPALEDDHPDLELNFILTYKILNIEFDTDEVVLRKFESNNVIDYKVYIQRPGEDYVEAPEYGETIPIYKLKAQNINVKVVIEKEDPSQWGTVKYRRIPTRKYLCESSYSFSLSWEDYANPDDGINCRDTFYEFYFNKVYTISQHIDRYSNYRSILPSRPARALQIKQITDSQCEGTFNTFPVNDVKYKNKFLVNIFIFIFGALSVVLFPLVAAIHTISLIFGILVFILNLIFQIIEIIVNTVLVVINFIIDIVNGIINGICDTVDTINGFAILPNIPVPGFCEDDTPINPIPEFNLPTLENPLKNFGLPLLLFTEDGCERCKCRDNDSEEAETIEPGGEGSDSELDGNLTALLESLTDCTKAVNFKANDNQGSDGEYCYNNTGGFVSIDPPTSDGYPICTTALSDAQTIIPEFIANFFNLDEPFKIFQYGRGCYNLVGKPVLSLLRDFASIAEWSNRVKVNIAICNEVFDHTFSNAWVNGTLFAFTFRNKVTFNALNQPVRKHCTELVIAHDPTNNYYYRVTPYGNTDSQVYSIDLNNGFFIGRPINTDAAIQIRGNEYQLMYPTTLIDLGPKVAYLKELSFTNQFDGYIMDNLDSTSYGDNTEILNLFVLSRLTNLSVVRQIASVFGPFLASASSGFGIPPGVVSSDPIINIFFQNTRWGNGYNFLGLPGLIDGDYSQSIAINSEFGIEKFTSEDANGAAVFFGEDSAGEGNSGVNKPLFGIFFETNDQLRDFLSPRRKIWNVNGNTNPNNVYDYESLPVSTQEVPYYKWRMGWNESYYVFGTQNNRTLTSLQDYNTGNGYTVFPSHGYQTLDRLDVIGSKYSPPDNILTEGKFYKGFITNYQADGSYKQYEPVGWNDNSVTTNMPFLFYFGLIKGASAYDLFSQKYIGTDEL